ncbi:MAG: MFS transporter [Bacteroidia bacterium]|nr:MFS transporter [Bacteroidia bacterium]MDW8301515.1 MFS transporter [Bacteroidia bacterium]
MSNTRSVYTVIIVAALGYFVDIYDIIVFSIVRLPSLQAIGITDPKDLERIGLFLLNMQMGGMLIGGIVWGILGDKKGRLSVLFGSIMMYSIANILNGMVADFPAYHLEMYAVMRFISGVGLAGELGAGITLVAEMMSKEKRGYGTMIVVSMGAMGAVAAGLVYQYFQDWKLSYFVGGVLGLVLLLLRIGVSESGMFQQIKEMQNISRGNFLMLFTNYNRFLTYLKCILNGLPVWYVVGILTTLSSEFARAFGLIPVTAKVDQARVVMYTYIGLTIGDVLSGTLSQILRSRKKTVVVFILFSLISSITFLTIPKNMQVFYWFYLVLGIGTGYWVVFVTIASEQFGTNLRATVTTTTPNFVRGSVIILTTLFQILKPLGTITSAIITALFSAGLALWALYGLQETFGKDLNYNEIDTPKNKKIV